MESSPTNRATRLAQGDKFTTYEVENSASDKARCIARRARDSDVPAIYALIARNAAQGLLLARTEEEIRTHTDRFLVVVERESLLGCVALEPYGNELAEIRSLAVDESARGRGLGVRLLRFALREAKRRGFTRVFAVTQAPHLFTRQGFSLTTRFAIPEKVVRDCRTCPEAGECEKAALIAVVAPERAALAVLRSMECGA